MIATRVTLEHRRKMTDRTPLAAPPRDTTAALQRKEGQCLKVLSYPPPRGQTCSTNLPYPLPQGQACLSNARHTDARSTKMSAHATCPGLQRKHDSTQMEREHETLRGRRYFTKGPSVHKDYTAETHRKTFQRHPEGNNFSRDVGIAVDDGANCRNGNNFAPCPLRNVPLKGQKVRFKSKPTIQPTWASPVTPNFPHRAVADHQIVSWSLLQGSDMTQTTTLAADASNSNVRSEPSTAAPGSRNAGKAATNVCVERPARVLFQEMADAVLYSGGGGDNCSGEDVDWGAFLSGCVRETSDSGALITVYMHQPRPARGHNNTSLTVTHLPCIDYKAKKVSSLYRAAVLHGPAPVVPHLHNDDVTSVAEESPQHQGNVSLKGEKQMSQRMLRRMSKLGIHRPIRSAPPSRVFSSEQAVPNATKEHFRNGEIIDNPQTVCSSEAHCCNSYRVKNVSLSINAVSTVNFSADRASQRSIVIPSASFRCHENDSHDQIQTECDYNTCMQINVLSTAKEDSCSESQSLTSEEAEEITHTGTETNRDIINTYATKSFSRADLVLEEPFQKNSEKQACCNPFQSSTAMNTTCMPSPCETDAFCDNGALVKNDSEISDCTMERVHLETGEDRDQTQSSNAIVVPCQDYKTINYVLDKAESLESTSKAKEKEDLKSCDEAKTRKEKNDVGERAETNETAPHSHKPIKLYGTACKEGGGSKDTSGSNSGKNEVVSTKVVKDHPKTIIDVTITERTALRHSSDCAYHNDTLQVPVVRKGDTLISEDKYYRWSDITDKEQDIHKLSEKHKTSLQDKAHEKVQKVCIGNRLVSTPTEDIDESIFKLNLRSYMQPTLDTSIAKDKGNIDVRQMAIEEIVEPLGLKSYKQMSNTLGLDTRESSNKGSAISATGATQHTELGTLTVLRKDRETDATEKERKTISDKYQQNPEVTSNKVTFGTTVSYKDVSERGKYLSICTDVNNGTGNVHSEVSAEQKTGAKKSKKVPSFGNSKLSWKTPKTKGPRRDSKLVRELRILNCTERLHGPTQRGDKEPVGPKTEQVTQCEHNTDTEESSGEEFEEVTNYHWVPREVDAEDMKEGVTILERRAVKQLVPRSNCDDSKCPSKERGCQPISTRPIAQTPKPPSSARPTAVRVNIRRPNTRLVHPHSFKGSLPPGKRAFSCSTININQQAEMPSKLAWLEGSSVAPPRGKGRVLTGDDVPASVSSKLYSISGNPVKEVDNFVRHNHKNVVSFEDVKEMAWVPNKPNQHLTCSGYHKVKPHVINIVKIPFGENKLAPSLKGVSEPLQYQAQHALEDANKHNGLTYKRAGTNRSSLSLTSYIPVPAVNNNNEKDMSAVLQRYSSLGMLETSVDISDTENPFAREVECGPALKVSRSYTEADGSKVKKDIDSRMNLRESSGGNDIRKTNLKTYVHSEPFPEHQQQTECSLNLPRDNSVEDNDLNRPVQVSSTPPDSDVAVHSLSQSGDTNALRVLQMVNRPLAESSANRSSSDNCVFLTPKQRPDLLTCGNVQSPKRSTSVINVCLDQCQPYPRCSRPTSARTAPSSWIGHRSSTDRLNSPIPSYPRAMTKDGLHLQGTPLLQEFRISDITTDTIDTQGCNLHCAMLPQLSSHMSPDGTDTAPAVCVRPRSATCSVYSSSVADTPRACDSQTVTISLPLIDSPSASMPLKQFQHENSSSTEADKQGKLSPRPVSPIEDLSTFISASGTVDPSTLQSVTQTIESSTSLPVSRDTGRSTSLPVSHDTEPPNSLPVSPTAGASTSQIFSNTTTSQTVSPTIDLAKHQIFSQSTNPSLSLPVSLIVDPSSSQTVSSTVYSPMPQTTSPTAEPLTTGIDYRTLNASLPQPFSETVDVSSPQSVNQTMAPPPPQTPSQTVDISSPQPVNITMDPASPQPGYLDTGLLPFQSLRHMKDPQTFECVRNAMEPSSSPTVSHVAISPCLQTVELISEPPALQPIYASEIQRPLDFPPHTPPLSACPPLPQSVIPPPSSQTSVQRSHHTRIIPKEPKFRNQRQMVSRVTDDRGPAKPINPDNWQRHNSDSSAALGVSQRNTDQTACGMPPSKPQGNTRMGTTRCQGLRIPVKTLDLELRLDDWKDPKSDRIAGCDPSTEIARFGPVKSWTFRKGLSKLCPSPKHKHGASDRFAAAPMIKDPWGFPVCDPPYMYSGADVGHSKTQSHFLRMLCGELRAGGDAHA